ncbi:MAG TPA: hypothetical protein VJ020_14670 [Anaerolineales bacterium]|nr:hypothetical protein [Anaerolineales bacterium]
MAQVAGAHSQATYEYPLFTDAHIIGEITSGYGPYEFLNTVPMTMAPVLAPAIVLRVEYYVEHEFDASRMQETNVQRYHGGLLNDEVAALISLCLGIRLQSGGYTRRFFQGSDPRGHPAAHEVTRDPVLPLPMGRSVILPRLLGDHSLEKVAPLKDLLLLSPASANALVRAARQYQDAVWIAEAEPELAWLMLVSAIEVAAGHWRSAKETPVERLTTSRPELERLLRTVGGEELVEQVAEQIADYMGATKKFIDFVLEFLPDPPPDRPPLGFQHSWDREAIKETLKIIYHWRSRALHGGTPFPMPMCEPPFPFQGGLAEKPVGLATQALGGIWMAKDAPMLLHTFEYIVRNALLRWLS